MSTTRKLLLADDSVTIQKVVNLTFADEGIEVIAVGDGDAAMQKFNEATPDLVMVDVNMPGLDGYRICEIIKQDEETKHIPVILLVGSFEPFDEEEAQRVGADDFLTKPFQSIRQLVNKVSDLLDGGKTADSDKTVAAVNSFDETVEPNTPHGESALPESFDDAGMDDEMIETSQIGSLPTDEAQKFTSPPIYESSAEDADFDSPEQQSSDFESADESTAAADDEDDDDWAETQPLLKEDVDEVTDDSPKSVAFNESVYRMADEEDLNDEFDQILASNKDTSAAPEDAPDFALDDFDLLELPQTKKESSSKIEWQDKFKTPSETSNQELSETSVEQIKPADDSAYKNNFSPEMIDAVADKVVEKISDRLIRRVVEEVIAQMADKK